MTIAKHIRPAAASALLLAAFALPGVSRSSAEPPKPFLHPLFTDNMVLQRGIADPVWGWAAPGESISVSFHGKTTSAVAGRDGKWTAKVGPFAAGGPYTLSVAGTQTVTLKNVMVGDVWLCSGQSNMEFGIGELVKPEETLAAAADPDLRLFTVPKVTAETPQSTLTAGPWQACSPDTLKTQGTGKGFSAVAYFFGRKLRHDVHVPIGLLLSSWGGTPAEAWTSEAGLRKNGPDFGPLLDQLDAAQGSKVTLDQQMADWYAKNDPGTPANWQSQKFKDSSWPSIPAPGLFQDAGIPELSGVNGVVWYRRTFDLPAGSAGKDAVLHLLVDDNDTTWVNGKQVGATQGYLTPRAYAVPAALLKPTGNVVAVRVLDTGGKGGIWGDPSGLNLSVTGSDPLPLAGPWRVKLGVSLAAAPPLPVSIENNQNFPSVLYNGQIAPLATFGIKGVIWYQGETNADRSAQYRRLLPALIGDWRTHWNEGPFPFLIVQLAGWQPGGPNYAALRDAQWRTAKTVPNAGIATAVDVGDQSDIHPKNKEEVGRRLALVAEAKVYGEKVPFAGPVYRSLSVSGASATLTFTHADGGLVSKSGASLTGFEIAGPDGVFVPATAHIVKDTVVVSSPKVSAPSAVRYAWSGFPECSLYNGKDLPAFPFDTSGQ